MAITLNEFKEAMENAGINPDIFSYTLIEDKDVEIHLDSTDDFLVTQESISRDNDFQYITENKKNSKSYSGFAVFNFSVLNLLN